jgi:hypothetical protein
MADAWPPVAVHAHGFMPRWYVESPLVRTSIGWSSRQHAGAGRIDGGERESSSGLPVHSRPEEVRTEQP